MCVWGGVVPWISETATREELQKKMTELELVQSRNRGTKGLSYTELRGKALDPTDSRGVLVKLSVWLAWLK